MLFATLHVMANSSPTKASGPTNGKWKGGMHHTEKGYLRLSAGTDRGKYAHRVVMEKLLQAPLCAPYVFPANGVIPVGMDVEHCDHNKTHNCHGNLMLLQHRIHACLSRSYQQYVMAHWEEYLAQIAAKNEAESVPDWVTSSEFEEAAERDGEAA